MKTKMKTRKSIAKRVRITAKGKLKYKKQGLRHILTKKSAKRKMDLRTAGVLDPVEQKRLIRGLPNR